MQRSVRQIVTTIEGIIELCLGKAGCVIWVDQADAAAFADGEKIYLPTPNGEHPEEYELLLSLGLREVAKLEHSAAADFALAADEVRPFASTFEDVRVKKLLGAKYRGAPQIFAKAFDVASGIFMKRAEGERLGKDEATQLAIWGQANDALIQSESSRQRADALVGIAADEFEVSTMGRALRLATQGPLTLSTAQAVELGAAVHGVLCRREPKNRDAEVEQPHDGDDRQTAGVDGQQRNQDGADQKDRGQGQQQEGADGNQQRGAGDQPQDQGVGDQRDGGQGQQQEGADANQQGGAGDQPQDRGSADQQSGGQETQPTTAGMDLLSDALAMLRGFIRARDCSAEAIALASGPAGTPSAPTCSGLRQAIAAALGNAENPLEALDAAVGMDMPAGQLATHADAAAVWLPEATGAGDAFAEQLCEAGNSLLPRVAGRLVSVLLRELQDRRRRPSRVGPSGPRVDVPGFWKLQRLGDQSVFRKKARVPGVSAAVQILLDRSGSMAKSLDAAADVTYALALAHHRIAGVQVAIDMFPGVEGFVEPVLAFGQNATLAKKMLHGVGATGGTPTGAALQSVIPRLLARRVEKRILYVLTDGLPSHGQRELTQHMIREAEAQGVELIGIGLRVDVGHLFPLSLTVSSVEELPRALEVLFKSEIAERLVA